MRRTIGTRAAGWRNDEIAAPSVGIWRPVVGVGAPMRPGAVLGYLVRDGRALSVTVPPSAFGVAVEVLAAGSWVAFDTTLVCCGEGGLGPREEAPEVHAGGPEGAVAVRAETEGTVYLRPEPGAAAFAPVHGDVAANDTLALVEVMKTFTPVRAPHAARVVRVDVDDAEAVVEGQVLFWMAAAGS